MVTPCPLHVMGELGNAGGFGERSSAVARFSTLRSPRGGAMLESGGRSPMVESPGVLGGEGGGFTGNKEADAVGV